MPRARGPIGYIEHRSPRKEENGKYVIHPQFVQKELYDAEKMASDSQGRCMANRSQFVSVMDTIESLTLQALGRGDAVRIGDICTIRPKLRVVHHEDENGEEYKKTYYKGDLIPANEVEVCGFDIQPTKEFMEDFMRHHFDGCSRQMWSVKRSSAPADKEEAFIIRKCEEQGYITVKDFMWQFNVTKACSRWDVRFRGEDNMIIGKVILVVGESNIASAGYERASASLPTGVARSAHSRQPLCSR